MSDVGVPANFVDTQDVSLTNVTNSLTYLQLTNVLFDIDSNIEKNQLTDDTIENVYSLRMNSIQGEMIVTTPQWAALVVLTVDSAGVRPGRLWEVSWTDASGTNVTTTFFGQIKTLRPIDSGIGFVSLFFRIEATEVVSVA